MTDEKGSSAMDVSTDDGETEASRDAHTEQQRSDAAPEDAAEAAATEQASESCDDGDVEMADTTASGEADGADSDHKQAARTTGATDGGGPEESACGARDTGGATEKQQPENTKPQKEKGKEGEEKEEEEEEEEDEEGGQEGQQSGGESGRAAEERADAEEAAAGEEGEEDTHKKSGSGRGTQNKGKAATGSRNGKRRRGSPESGGVESNGVMGVGTRRQRALAKHAEEEGPSGQEHKWQRRNECLDEVSAIEQKFAELKAEYFTQCNQNIQEEIDAIRSGDHAEYNKRCEELHDFKEEKLWASEQWKNYQIENANNVYDGDVRAAESEHVYGKKQLRDRMMQSLRERRRKLREEQNRLNPEDSSYATRITTRNLRQRRDEGPADRGYNRRKWNRTYSCALHIFSRTLEILTCVLSVCVVCVPSFLYSFSSTCTVRSQRLGDSSRSSPDPETYTPVNCTINRHLDLGCLPGNVITETLFSIFNLNAHTPTHHTHTHTHTHTRTIHTHTHTYTYTSMANIWQAAKDGDLSRVTLLLDRGHDVNEGGWCLLADGGVSRAFVCRSHVTCTLSSKRYTDRLSGVVWRVTRCCPTAFVARISRLL
jgi:Sds3-like